MPSPYAMKRHDLLVAYALACDELADAADAMREQSWPSPFISEGSGVNDREVFGPAFDRLVKASRAASAARTALRESEPVRVGSVVDAIGCVGLEDSEHHPEIVLHALASYFDDHMNRPENDPVDDEFGWGEWVIVKSNDAMLKAAKAALSALGVEVPDA